MANQRNPDGTVKITGVRGSSSSKKNNSSNKGSSSSSSNRRPSSSSSSGNKRAPGTIYSSGGKDYIVSNSGLSVSLNSDAGKRLQSQYGGGSRGSSSGSSGLRVNVAGAQEVNGSRGGTGYNFSTGTFATPKIERYQNDSGITSASADYGTKKVARLKNGLQVTQQYIDENPDKEYYTMDSSPNIRSAGTIGNVPRYGSGSSSYGMVFNGKPVAIHGADGLVYYPDNAVVPEDAWASMQARMDYQYGNGGEDITRQGLPQTYYDVLADLNAGRGYNGSGLRMGTPEWEAIWGGGEFNQDAYNQLVAQGAVAPYRDYWGQYGNLSPESGGFSRNYNAAPLNSTGNESDLETVTTPAGGYGTGFSINNNTKGIPNTGLYPDGMVDYMDEYRAAIRAAQEASAEAYEEQINAGLAALNAQRDPLQQQYNDSAQQAYINSMLAKRNLPQQLAAQGISGGASESSNLAIETSYGNSLNNLTSAYNQSLADLESDIAQYRATGNSQLAQNAARYEEMLANAALQQLQQQQQYQQNLAAMAYQAQLEQQAARENMALQLAYDQAKQGISGGSSGGSSGRSSTDWDMLNRIIEDGVANGDISWSEGARATAQIAQGIMPDILSTLLNPTSSATTTAPSTQMTIEKLYQLLQSGDLTPLEAQRHAANLGISLSELY